MRNINYKKIFFTIILMVSIFFLYSPVLALQPGEHCTADSDCTVKGSACIKGSIGLVGPLVGKCSAIGTLKPGEMCTGDGQCVPGSTCIKGSIGLVGPLVGKCSDIANNSTTPTPTEKPFKPIEPTLQIKIPTVIFSKIIKEGDILKIPFLADYIKGVYKYAVSIVSIIAVVMIMVGGLTWLTAGGSGERIRKAKETISGSVIGLFLVFGSYVLLNSISTNLTDLGNTNVKYIEGQSIENVEFVSDNNYSKITKQSNPGKEKIIQLAIQIAQNTGITDTCRFVAIVTKESGGNPGAIGHDENYQGPVYVWSRRDFLMSGKKSSGATFTPPFTNKNDYIPTVHNKLSILNDDKFDVNNPPNYGLDWRFSHGFGLGQMTLKKPSSDIPKLLTIEYTLQKSANLFKSNLNCAEKYGYSGEEQLRAAYFAYAAGCGGLSKIKNKETFYTNRASTRAMSHYNSCKSKAATPQAAPDPQINE